MNKSEEKYKNIFTNLPDIYFETDLDGTISIISPSIRKITGYDIEDLIGENINLLFKGNNYSILFSTLLSSGQSISNYEIELTSKDKKNHQTLVSANLLLDKNGIKIGIFGLIKDICDRKKLVDKLYRFASYDELTGIYNRRVGIEFLNQELKKIKRGNTFLSICYIDINDLKIVNDNFGHEAADNLIKIIVQDIKEAMRESDILCRLGGDEFLLIFPDCKLNKVKNIWKRVQKSLENRNKTESKRYKISVSYGFAETNSENPLRSEELLQIADKRMYNNKRRTKKKLPKEPLLNNFSKD
ncbi:MAG: GGDEF domain-containing protein [Spirochaetaceae bacterium]|nr:GGDEF domain-containing protein [Spirochaetaceae bacterium]